MALVKCAVCGQEDRGTPPKDAIECMNDLAELIHNKPWEHIDNRAVAERIRALSSAWEKERAEWEEERKEVAVEGVQEVAGFIRDYTRLQDKLNALRAEVQAVEEEMERSANRTWGSPNGNWWNAFCEVLGMANKWASRLRKARTGE